MESGKPGFVYDPEEGKVNVTRPDQPDFEPRPGNVLTRAYTDAFGQDHVYRGHNVVRAATGSTGGEGSCVPVPLDLLLGTEETN